MVFSNSIKLWHSTRKTLRQCASACLCTEYRSYFLPIANHRVRSHPHIRNASTSTGAFSQTTLNRIPGVDIFHSDVKPVLDLGDSKVPSVSKILHDTESAESRLNLRRWKERMIKEMGESAFAEYQAGILRRGTAIHSNIQSCLLGDDYEVADEVVPYMSSVSSQLDKFHDVLECECRLTHSSLAYCGVIDCVAEYNSSGLYVIDWKTSSKKKTTLSATFDQPLQLVSYVGLWNNRNPNDQIRQAMLVMMYADGQPCDIIKMNENALKMYWRRWKIRVAKYWQDLSDTIPQY